MPKQPGREAGSGSGPVVEAVAEWQLGSGTGRGQPGWVASAVSRLKDQFKNLSKFVKS